MKKFKKIKLTNEQMEIANSKEKSIKVNACAGSGKTSTLFFFSKNNPNNNILLLVYNRAMKIEIEQKFATLRNVVVKTLHSLGYGDYGYKYKHKLTFGYKAFHLAKDLDFNLYNSNQMKIVAKALKIFKEYLISDKDNFEEIEEFKNIEVEFKNDKEQILKILNKIWEKKKDLKDETKITHDFYLKLYQLSKPDLSKQYDLILLDEAQDTNDVALDIFNIQNVERKVIVGDTHQQIYGWRGAVNALDKVEGKEYFLTNSFRIGQDVANIANKILIDFKKIDVGIKGKNKNQLIVRNINKNKQFTKICRTRSMIFKNAIEAISNDKKVYFEGGVQGYNFNTFNEAWRFYNGEKTRDPLLVHFNSYSEMVDYAENVQDLDLLFLKMILEKYNSSIPKYVKMLNQKNNQSKEGSDLILTTLHKAKGLEYENLILENDFIDLLENQEKIKNGHVELEEIKEEINILYVAITRAKGMLELNYYLKEYLKMNNFDINYSVKSNLIKIDFAIENIGCVYAYSFRKEGGKIKKGIVRFNEQKNEKHSFENAFIKQLTLIIQKYVTNKEDVLLLNIIPENWDAYNGKLKEINQELKDKNICKELILSKKDSYELSFLAFEEIKRNLEENIEIKKNKKDFFIC